MLSVKEPFTHSHDDLFNFEISPNVFLLGFIEHIIGFMGLVFVYVAGFCNVIINMISNYRQRKHNKSR